jgi:hypothetical protein
MVKLGLLKVFVHSLSNPLLPLSLPIRHIVSKTLSILTIIFNIFLFLFLGSSRLVYGLVAIAEWKLLIMGAAAWKLVSYLPGMAGSILAGGGEVNSLSVHSICPGREGNW